MALGERVGAPKRIERESGPVAFRKGSRFSDVKWARPDLNRRPSGYQPARQRKCRWERPYPIWDPDDPPADALDRSFAWLAEIAYSEVEIARSSTEDDLDKV